MRVADISADRLNISLSSVRLIVTFDTRDTVWLLAIFEHVEIASHEYTYPRRHSRRRGYRAFRRLCDV